MAWVDLDIGTVTYCDFSGEYENEVRLAEVTGTCGLQANPRVSETGIMSFWARAEDSNQWKLHIYYPSNNTADPTDQWTLIEESGSEPGSPYAMWPRAADMCTPFGTLIRGKRGIASV